MDIAVQMFYYTIDGGRLAGLPGPAFVEWDFARLRKMGYSVVVSLECDRLNTFEIEDAGFEHKKICVEDFAPPTLDQVDEFVSFVDAKLAEGKKVLVHCYAGRGRTGTMLAAFLIHRGASSDAAIREIRERAGKAYGTIRGVIEPEQEEFLHRFARSTRVT
jgi:atypical dual specificity phosphatase